jgi:hypothetical protein
LRHYLARQTGQDNRNMRALPFRRDRAIASAAASASTSGIGSGSPTYGRDVSEIVHRCHHGRRVCSSSVVSRSSSYGGVICSDAWRIGGTAEVIAGPAGFDDNLEPVP